MPKNKRPTGNILLGGTSEEALRHQADGESSNISIDDLIQIFNNGLIVAY